MKFSLSWLADHLDFDANIDDIAGTLNSLGLEVEGIEQPGEELAAFRTAKILAAEPHPDADRLQVCTVDDSSEETLQIVCGAPNARAGLNVVLAPVGTLIPAGNFKIKASKIRGVASNGMLCSAAELGLGEDSDGIIELPDGTKPGQPIASVLGLNDTIIDLGLTPNRGDCLAVRGIARELAAAGLGTMKPQAAADIITAGEAPTVTIDHPEDCPVFATCLLENVTNGDSPAWLQQRLQSIGLNPVSSLVDVSNYYAYDLGRPLHVFDADKVQGKLAIARAAGGEKFAALDDKEYTLPKDAIVIKDDSVSNSGIISLAGIMGGASTAVDENTKNVLLESAVFDAAKVMLTGQSTMILSDARHRFERGVDPAQVVPGIELAAQMIQQHCGGSVSSVKVSGAVPTKPPVIDFDPATVTKLSGMELLANTCQELLAKLGFETNGNSITVPSWRHDFTGEHADGPAGLVEEILRLHGYDNIPETPLPMAVPVAVEQNIERRSATALANQGWQEAVTLSFTSITAAEQFGGQDDAGKLRNPISADAAVLRPNLLVNLLPAVVENYQRGQLDGKLFEVGAAFTGTQQRDTLAGVMWGDAVAGNWQHNAQPVDAFTAKSAVLNVLESVGAPVTNLQTNREVPDYYHTVYHPGQSGQLRLGKNMLARFGVLHPAMAKQLELDGIPVAIFEVELEAISTKRKPIPAYQPSQLQPLKRDFAFLLADNTPAEELLRLIRGVDRQLINAVDVFDVYAGKGVPEGQKSLAISVQLQPQKETLTDEQITALSSKIVSQVADKLGGQLRG